MRRAPPTVPGTPIRPSMPPKSCFAQKVTVRPRSAAASTLARFPSMMTSGSGGASCKTTQGSSPSLTRRFEPPPRNLCGMWFASRRLSRSGIVSCFLMRSRSVVPPMPREVNSDSFISGRNSTPSSARLATILGSLTRMLGRLLRSEKRHELVAGAADAACADGQNRVGWARLAQQVLDSLLHRRKVMNVFVPGIANGFGKDFAGNAGNGRFAGGVDIRQDENVGLVEGATEFVPKMLRTRVAMRLKKHQQAAEFASTGSFERSADFRRVMAVVIDDGDAFAHALDIEAAANASELGQAFPNQVRADIEIQSHGRSGSGVANVVHARRVR